MRLSKSAKTRTLATVVAYCVNNVDQTPHTVLFFFLNEVYHIYQALWLDKIKCAYHRLSESLAFIIADEHRQRPDANLHLPNEHQAEECALPLGHGSKHNRKETHNTDNNDYWSDHLKQTSKIPFTTNLGWRKQGLFQLR